jgi:uncharacterized OB-fold protein
MTAEATDDWLLDASLAPDTGGHLAPLYAGAAEGRLTLPFCSACGLPLELEQEVCDGCGGTAITWRDVVGEGTVHSVTVVRRREAGLVRTEDPYAVADVELTSGHRVLLAACRPSPPPPIGTPVTVAFRFLGGVAVPAYDAAVPVYDPPTPLPQESPR